MLKGKILLDYANLFPPNGYAKKLKKLYCSICGKYRKFEKPKI